MFDLLMNFGALAGLAILCLGAVVSLFLLHKVVGEEASVFIGVALAAYPAFLVYRKIEM